jgi:hypothetical protein
MGTCIIWAGGSRGGTGVLGVARLPGPMKGVESAAAGFGIGMLGPVGIIGVTTDAGSGVGMRIWGGCGTTGGTYTAVACQQWVVVWAVVLTCALPEP